MEENINTQQDRQRQMPIIGQKAPEFTANTTQGQINFPKDYKGKWIILFSHPADFTPVCTTEFMTFASMSNEFEKLNVQLVGLSVDSIHAHIAWLNRIKELEWKNISKPDVQFPLIDDVTMNIANLYGMIHGQDSTSAIRAVFFIDPKGIIRTILYYPASLGRNFDEIKRIVIALQTADAQGVATPADWHPGDDVIEPSPSTMAGLKKRVEEDNPGETKVDWFLKFKPDEVNKK